MIHVLYSDEIFLGVVEGPDFNAASTVRSWIESQIGKEPRIQTNRPSLAAKRQYFEEKYIYTNSLKALKIKDFITFLETKGYKEIKNVKDHDIINLKKGD